MIVKEGYMAIKDEKGTVMRCSYQSKKDANELLGRMMNQDISWKIKLFSIDVKMLEGKDRMETRTYSVVSTSTSSTNSLLVLVFIIVALVISASPLTSIKL